MLQMGGNANVSVCVFVSRAVLARVWFAVFVSGMLAVSVCVCGCVRMCVCVRSPAAFVHFEKEESARKALSDPMRMFGVVVTVRPASLRTSALW